MSRRPKVPENRYVFIEEVARRAIVLELGGSKPPADPLSSWFGRVNAALPGEGWPMMGREPMVALAQVNMTEMPFRPPGLEDLAFITLFMGPRQLPIDHPNGTHWCLRAYPSLEGLVALDPVETDSAVKAFHMSPRVLDQDFPGYEDVPVPFPTDMDEDDYDELPNNDGFKLGGWPTLIQSEVEWAPKAARLARPEYVFQVGTTEKGCWSWGDQGVGYFGRGTTEDTRNTWFCTWQCY